MVDKSQKETGGLYAQAITEVLKRNKAKTKFMLRACAHCTLCADSCFLYVQHKKDPRYVPGYKVINSVGTIFRKRGNVDDKSLKTIKDLVFHKCVLCTRCHCPLGIDIPSMITLARDFCRSRGVTRTYEVEIPRSLI